MTNARTHSSSGSTARLQAETRRGWSQRAAGVLARSAALLLLGGMAVGCGSSDKAGPFDDFVGLWIRQPMAAAGDTRTFSVSCTTQGVAEEVPVWDTMEFEEGVLTDVNEMGPCLFSYNVDGNVATLANPDPYVNSPPACLLFVSRPSGDPAILELAPTMGAGGMWSFTITPGMLPAAQLLGTSAARYSFLDAAGAVVTAEPCTYTLLDKFIKLTKP
jgi:hypothetical protein